MHNVAFDIVNPKPELLAVRVVPGNGPPLRTSNHHHLSVDPVVFAPAKSVWKADVEPIQGCAQIVGNRDGDENVIRGSIPGRTRGFYPACEGVRLHTLVHQRYGAPRAGETFNLCLSGSDVHYRPPRRTCRRAAPQSVALGQV